MWATATPMRVFLIPSLIQKANECFCGTLFLTNLDFLNQDYVIGRWLYKFWTYSILLFRLVSESNNKGKTKHGVAAFTAVIFNVIFFLKK